MHLRQELETRGLLYQFSDEKLFDLYDKWGQAFYFGVDPSADSLHIGNFVVFMNAVNFMKRNNKLYLIVWWATGMIGDPGGKNAERSFLDEEVVKHNVAAITKQVKWVLENLTKLSGAKFQFEVLNNADFYTDMGYLKFLREVGKYMSVNQMMNKETVKRRLENPETGISYAEFSYMLIQWYDFLRLHTDKKVNLQICWSDQRGNGVTGIELIRKKLDHESYVMSGPLVMDSSGKKFGKSEWNAIFLDPNKTSPYFAYQYFMNTMDEDVERFLKLFTLLDFETIDGIVKNHIQNPELRFGQKQLANYVITTVYGAEASEQAQKITDILFSDDKMNTIKTLNSEDIQALMREVGWSECRMQNAECRIIDLCVQSWLVESNGEAKKLIQSGSLFCNEVKIEDPQLLIEKKDFINGIVLLRKGKKVFKVVKLS